MVTLIADGDHVAVLRAFATDAIGAYRLRTSSEGFTLSVERKDLHKAVAILERLCYNYQMIGSDAGFFARKLLGSLPVLIASLLCAIMVFASDMFVWKVSVTGADESLSLLISDVAGEYGAYPGGVKSGVDADGAVRAIYGLPDIAAVSVYYTGNTFNVNVLTGENSGLPVSGVERIYSGYDAVVTRVDAEKGTSLVSAGDTVSVGETLIVGETYSTADGSLLFTGEARGKVYGRVTFVHTRYCSSSELIRTGRSESHTALGLFGHTSSFGESPFERYETVTERKKLYPFGVEVVTTTYYELEDASEDDETQRFIEARKEELYGLYGEIFDVRTGITSDGRAVIYFTAEICIGEA